MDIRSPEKIFRARGGGGRDSQVIRSTVCPGTVCLFSSSLRGVFLPLFFRVILFGHWLITINYSQNHCLANSTKLMKWLNHAVFSYFRLLAAGSFYTIPLYIVVLCPISRYHLQQIDGAQRWLLALYLLQSMQL